MTARRKKLGTLTIVGAGPGQVSLLTTAATEAISVADLVMYDAGVGPDVLATIQDETERTEILDPAAAVASLMAAVRDGRSPVLLLGGDAFSSPLGVAAGVAATKAKARLTVVPGLPLDVAIPSYAGVPVGVPHTAAEISSSADADWPGLSGAPGTLVLTLGPTLVGKAAAALMENGRRGDTPVAVTLAGATTRQTTLVSTLDSIEAELTPLLRAAGNQPGVLVVGDVVKLRDKLSWWDARPLFGWSVLVPRTREQGSALSATLRDLGADPLEVPTIAVEPPRTPAPMERALRGLVGGRYAWVAFTSANAVKAVREKLEESGLDARAFAGVKLAAVGEATAAALLAFGLRADLVPEGVSSSEGLLAEWPERDDQLDVLDRVLLPRADIATETLAAGLKAKGWAIDDITAYRTVRAAPPAAPVREAIKSGKVDAVLFTSSSTVRNLVGIAGKPHESTVIGVIGPQTAKTAEELGLRVDFMATTAVVDVLARDLADFAVARRLQEAAEAPDAGPILSPAARRAAKKEAAPRARRSR